MKEPKLSEIMRFILDHPKRDRIMKNFSVPQLMTTITESLEDGGLVLVTSPGQIDGVAVCHPNHRNKTIFVSILICRGKRIVEQLMDSYDKYFPNYEIQSLRRGRLVSYSNVLRARQLLGAI